MMSATVVASYPFEKNSASAQSTSSPLRTSASLTTRPCGFVPSRFLSEGPAAILCVAAWRIGFHCWQTDRRSVRQWHERTGVRKMRIRAPLAAALGLLLTQAAPCASAAAPDADQLLRQTFD